MIKYYTEWVKVNETTHDLHHVNNNLPIAAIATIYKVADYDYDAFVRSAFIHHFLLSSVVFIGGDGKEYDTLEEAKIACERKLQELGWSYLPKDRVEKIGVLL